MVKSPKRGQRRWRTTLKMSTSATFWTEADRVAPESLLGPEVNLHRSKVGLLLQNVRGFEGAKTQSVVAPTIFTFRRWARPCV